MTYDEFYDFVVKVHSIAKIGLTYSKDPYAITNYNEINNLSLKMLENFEDVKFDRNNYFTYCWGDKNSTSNCNCTS